MQSAWREKLILRQALLCEYTPTRSLREKIPLTDTLVIVSKDEMLRRIHCDYLEMPDLRLSRAQAQRVWQLDEHTCTELLESLTDGGLLQRSHDGMYALLSESAVAPLTSY